MSVHHMLVHGSTAVLRLGAGRRIFSYSGASCYRDTGTSGTNKIRCSSGGDNLEGRSGKDLIASGRSGTRRRP